jgi:energy-coupling factor transporter ATP-binding protein EcfA2
MCSIILLLIVVTGTGCQPEFKLGELVFVTGPMASGTGTVVDVKKGIDISHETNPEQVYYKIQSGPMTNEYRKIGDVRVNMRTINQVWIMPKHIEKINKNKNAKFSANNFVVGECVAITSASGDATGKVVNIEMGRKLNQSLVPKGLYYKIQFGADTNDTDGFWIDHRVIKKIYSSKSSVTESFPLR